MLGKIKATKNVHVTLMYNEKKVSEQKAVFLLGENFVKHTEELTFSDKADRLRQLASLHAGVAGVAHVFLNFDPKYQPTNDIVVQLARRYMAAAGFADQPYLVYRHFDTWHPHAHIVSTNVRADRTLVRRSLTETWKLIELTQHFEREFSLKISDALLGETKDQIKANHAQRVVYGKNGLHHSISKVLDAVIEHYKYTSLEDLNAVFQEYNVKAEPGREGTPLYQHRGLVYVALDEQGRQISRGIKASSFNLKPTLPYLENKFAQNQSLRESQRRRITTTIEWTFAGKPPDWEGFEQAMQREGINIIVQETRDKRPADIYFIDHQGKSVFSGAGLGTEFTLNAIREKCAREQQQQEETQKHHLKLRL